MEIIWPTLGICVLVCFVFFVLVQHWQRVLRHQTWTIRRLNERVRLLEEVDDPEFRRKLGESAPSPLEQVFTFSFRLSDQFWRDTLHASEEDSSFIRAFGSFLGSVKIESAGAGTAWPRLRKFCRIADPRYGKRARWIVISAKTPAPTG